MKGKDSFNKKLLIGFASAVLLTAVALGLSYKTISDLQDANDWVVHTQDVMSKVYRIQSVLSDAENDHDLYLLTSDTGKLLRYSEAAKIVPLELDSLKLLVSDNRSQVKKVDSMTRYSNLALAEASIFPADHSQNALTTTYKNYQLSAGRQAFSRCSEISDRIVAVEKRLLASRTAFSDKSAGSAFRLLFIIGIVTFAVLSLLFGYIRRIFRVKRQLHEKLQLSETKFSKIFRDSGVGMAIVSLSGDWLEINPYLLKMLGYTREEMLSKTFQEITHPDDLGNDLTQVWRLLKGDGDTYKIEKRYFHSNGSIVWTLLTVSLIYNEDGSARFFVSQIEDISPTKQLINQLQVKNEALSATSEDLKNKITQLEEFNRIVAHNLRGPASSIQMLTGMLKETSAEEEKAELLGYIDESSKSLNSTLKELVEVLEESLKPTVPFEDCDLVEMVEKTRQMLQGDILNAKATIQTNFGTPTVYYPKIYLENLFYNMISNSLKYKKKDEPATIRISSVKNEDGTSLIFEDDGLGIDLSRHAGDIFKLNQVFHKGYDSKGIGLYITKKQLERNGSRITVESEPEKGSTFTVAL